MSDTTSRVWAPFAGAVELVVGDRRHPMTRDAAGWWTAPRTMPPGTDYGFALDGDDEVLPDPRSAWQPDGVHGRSRTVDHRAFTWTDHNFRAAPLADAILYELHVGTFTPAGTFDGAIERLADVAALGVTHLELMPVAEFSGERGWGYDGVDLFAPHHAYGGPDGMRRFVDAAHGHGLAVLLDVVYNHVGPEGNYLGRFGPYFTERYRTPWGAAMNFDDRGSHEVRRFVVDNALSWLRDYHLDGLRLDAVHAIFDMSAVPILEELAIAVHALGSELGRELILVAESDLNDPRLVRPARAGGHGIDAAWADDVHHALHVALTGETGGYYADFVDPAMLARALRDPYVYDDRYSPARDRRHGRPAGDLPGDRFVVFLQNHDQVGNRARGERLGHLVSAGRLRLGAALLLTAPYVPLLFAGEEWGASAPFPYFSGHEDPVLAAAVREGRRGEFAAFGWRPDEIPDPQDPATFHGATLDWAERQQPPHADLLAWYRDLIALRRGEPALRADDRSAVRVDGSPSGSLAVRRGPIRIVANLGDKAVELSASGTPRLAWPAEAAAPGPRRRLPPDGVIILDDR